MSSGEKAFVSPVWQSNMFENRVIFCTGGSGDICSAQVKALVYLGANAFIVGRNPDKAQRIANEIARCRPNSRVISRGNIDVRRYDDLVESAADCVRELGRIDFVIAGAAGNFLSPILKTSPNAFRSVVEIDLIGSYNVAKATLPHLLAATKSSRGESGRILFISSTMQYKGTQLVTHGAAAKAGVDVLSAQIAIELGPMGISSNVLAPGYIDGTEGMERLGHADQARTIPLGRLGTLKDMGDAAVYLFSAAGSYITGAVLVVDGGEWRTAGQSISGAEYPSIDLLTGTTRSNVKL